MGFALDQRKQLFKAADGPLYFMVCFITNDSPTTLLSEWMNKTMKIIALDIKLALLVHLTIKKTTVSDAILSETQFVMLQLMLFIKCFTKDTNIKKKKTNTNCYKDIRLSM